MAKIIYKYKITELLHGRTTYLTLHKGCKILTIQAQDGEIYLWAEVDITQPQIDVFIECNYTGMTIHPADMPREYIATVQHPVNGEVYHFYELI